jgi:CelD/BcsL family acetyltransferase involved in cellulose biosynthesis
VPPAHVPARDVRITLAAVRDFAAVEAAWRALEPVAAPSFFQSWTWVGCLAEERFPDPVLLRAECDGRIVGLALLNRRQGRLGEHLWLGASGDPVLDAIYVEHNGPLLARDAADLLAPCLAALLTAPVGPRGRRAWWGRRVRLAGVDAATLAAAREVGTVRVLHGAAAPSLDLTRLAPGPEGFLAALSANTRAQLRRSDRAFAAAGPIVARRAETLAEAEAFLAELAMLHQARWQARGKPGAFANPAFARFHRALIARALPRGEAVLLRVSAGENLIGLLYNFRLGGREFAYQSGFAYATAPAHGKPGLTCHHAAIARARAEGLAEYDFLAGADRYKISFANQAAPLHWLDAAAPGTPAGAALWLRVLAQRVRARAVQFRTSY